MRGLIDSTIDHIWCVDLDFRLVAFNCAVANYFEHVYGVRIAAGTRLHDHIPPDRAVLWPAFYRRALDQGPFKTEYPAPGSRTFEFAIGPVYIDGAAIGISVFGKDISERRQAATALAESEIAFRSFFEENGSAMLLVDPDGGRIVNANRAAAAFYGYPQQTLIGMNVSQINPAPAAEIARNQQRTMRGELNLVNYRIRRSSGELRDVEVYTTPFHLKEKKVIFAIVHDITERKKAEEALHESQELLLESQSIGSLGSYLLDIPASTWTSSEVLDGLFGIAADYDHSVAGWLNLVHPGDRAMMLDHFNTEVVGNHDPFNKEYRIIRQSDQAVRWVHGLGRLEFDAENRPLRMRGVIKDITERKEHELRLQESEERFRATFEQAGVGIVHTALDGRFIRSNQRFAEIIGYPIAEIAHLSFLQITRPEDVEESLRILKGMQTGDVASASWEKRYVRKDGSLTWVRLTTSTLRDMSGRVQHYIGVVEDINARKAAEADLAALQEKLRASETLYRAAFQTSLDAISIAHASDGVIIEVNQSFLDLIGFERDEVIGRSTSKLGIWADPRDRALAAGLLQKDKVVRNLETRFKKKNGQVFSILCSASLFEIDGELCVLTIARDISEVKAAQAEIRNLVFYDPLTGLPNRRMFLDRLRMALHADHNHGARNAVLLIDLDNFKSLNETLGHAMGDLFLQEAARRLAACLRDADTLARQTGDEFLILIDDLSPLPAQAERDAAALGQRILASISEPYTLAERQCRVTASIGISIPGVHAKSVELVLQHADIALAHAKADGSNCVRFFSPAQQDAIRARAAMEEDLRRAIEESQFQLYYQPQVQHGRIVAVEALLRWNHPRRGILAPAEFIALAEDTGLILPLGDWVLETACSQIAAWAAGPPADALSIAVNISARQFRQPDFVRRVLAAINGTGANPLNLILELTESLLVDDIDDVVSKMTELKLEGLHFALDDFGTGYSSLSYLKQLPLDQLKIDRSFVRDILVDECSGAIAQAIVSISRTMSLSVIAEGVETAEQHEFLTTLGCNSFQGYLFGPPIPLTEFTRLWLDPSQPLLVGAR